MHARPVVLYTTSIAVAIIVGNIQCKTATKIIGGRPINIKYRPFMLSLHNSQGFICGASILSRNWGITALHCLTQDIVTDYYVRAGSNRYDRGGTLHKLTKIHVYNDSTYQYGYSDIWLHDIALFEIQPRFRFSSTVGTVQLPSEFTKPPNKLYICGWGYTSHQSNAKASNLLLGVSVPYTPYEICKNEAPVYQVLVNENYHLCYGSFGKDSCYGDSGGPLASRNTIYGIVSFGQNCGIVSGVYVKVSYYREWIAKTISP